MDPFPLWTWKTPVRLAGPRAQLSCVQSPHLWWKKLASKGSPGAGWMGRWVVYEDRGKGISKLLLLNLLDHTPSFSFSLTSFNKSHNLTEPALVCPSVKWERLCIAGRVIGYWNFIFVIIITTTTSLCESFAVWQDLWCAECTSFALLHLVPTGINGHSLNLKQSKLEIEFLKFCVTQWEIN